jgi:hypothetical protein
MYKYIWFSQEEKERNESNRKWSTFFIVVGLLYLSLSPWTRFFSVGYAALGIVFIILATRHKNRVSTDTLKRIEWKLDQIAKKEKLDYVFEKQRIKELEENV